MGDYVLWCLNRVAGWEPAPLLEALEGRSFFSQRHQVRAGSRTAFDRTDFVPGTPPDQGPRPALMHEDGECGEYFVPLVVKCVGDPQGFLQRLGGKLTPEGRQRFDALVAHYPEHFQPGAPCHWQGYWTPAAKVGMFTAPQGPRPHAGLYEVLHAERRAGEKAVLAGYSQGGLVAHFLAWMDEYLLQPSERCVAGVVTVQAPNAGSPFAHRHNGDAVATGIFAALSGALGYPTVEPPGAAAGGAAEPVIFPTLGAAFGRLAAGRLVARDGPRHFDIDAVCALLEAALADGSPEQRSELLSSARKWLSGLTPTVPSTAFQDLAPSELDNPGAVLNLLATQPLQQTLHAAVVGTDTSAEDFVRAELPLSVKVVLFFKPNAAGLQDRLRRLSSAYSQLALNELATGRTLGPLEARVASEYVSGVTVQTPGGAPEALRPLAHDFVIPSASQALGPRGGGAASPQFLGNLINAKGTHLSGAGEDGDGSDAPLVRQALKLLAARL